MAGQIAGEIDRIPIAEYSAEPAFPLDRTVAAFDTTMFRASGLPIEGHRVIVVLETRPNSAVGASAWGPTAAGAPVLIVGEGERLDLPTTIQPVLVGTANHRRAWVRELIDDTRRRHPSTVVVDMGWPGDDRQYADVATFGASRHVGLALLDWLDAQAIA